MNRFIKASFYFIFLLGIAFVFAKGGEYKEKTFPAKKTVKIKTVSGDCMVKTGNVKEILVEVIYDVDPADSFEPEIEEGSNSIKIKERWFGSSSGTVKWTITVPKGTEIEFKSASGELSVSGLNSRVEASTASGDISLENIEGEVEVSTASGEIELVDVKGDISLSTASGDIDGSNLSGDLEMGTASGDIKVEKATGSFDLGCASGSIKMKDLSVQEESSFSTASGEVSVSFATTPEKDLEFSSASGDVTVDYKGNDIVGSFEFTARKSKGRISSAIDFDDESEFERDGRTYLKKSFKSGSDKPLIKLDTASGNLRLNK